MELIKAKTRWDEDGSSFQSLSIVEAIDIEEIEEELNFRCYCEHDCCGHVSQRVLNIRPLVNGKFAVRLYGYRNI